MKIRTKCPKNNKYYIRRVTGGLNSAVAGYPMQKDADVLDNCVGFANGRFNEIINDPNLEGLVKNFKYQLVCDAEDFIESAKSQGLKISSTPIEGGIMVWRKGATLSPSDGAGHVAVVERVYDDGSILTSESGWASWAFKTVRRDNSNGRWGQNEYYTFRGCVKNPSIKNPKVVPIPPLTVDGIGGACTIRAMQRYFDTPQDGVISGQNKSLKSHYPSIKAVEYGSGGSVCIKKLQKWCGVTADGVLGENTVKAWQKKLGVTADGVFSANSMKAWQKYLNSKLFSDNPEPTKPTKPSIDYKVIDISEFQDTIDFAKVKASGVKGVIVRCGYRGAEKGTLNEDKRFVEHITNAHKAGLAVGIYMFTQGINSAEGKVEADFAIECWQKTGVPLSYPIAIDTENVNIRNARANGLSKAKRTEVIKAFCEEIKAQGFEPMIYASTSWLNNKLDMSKLPYKVWCAQYNDVCEYKGEYVMWQYTSTGKVNGVSSVVDMNHCYIDPKLVEPPKKGYDGEMPTLKQKKINAEVKADAVRFARWIATDNDFHYGHGKDAHHNGCFFCGTQPKSKKTSGIVDWQKTYCCNPFVGACWAHGGCVPKALSLCQKGKSWDFGVGVGYDASSLFDKLGKPKKETLEKGDVLCTDSHIAIYIGNGKIAEAASSDDNKKGSASWNNSIHIASLTDNRYKSFKRVYRYNGSVNTTANIYFGEISKRVEHLQKYLIWYGYSVDADGIYGSKTLEAVKDMQTKLGVVADGIIGANTLDAMEKVVK